MGGRIAVQAFANMSLGTEMGVINGMQLGAADMTLTAESLRNRAPMAALLAPRYACKSLAHMDGVAGGQIKAKIVVRAQIRPLAYFGCGPRNLTSNRAINSPEDLNGLKLRMPNVPLFVEVWKALGALPTPLALMKSANFNEVQKFVNKTEPVGSPIHLTTAELTRAKLSDADNAAVTEAGKRAQADERDPFPADQTAVVAELDGKRITFVEVDGAAFPAKAKDAVRANVKIKIHPIVQDLFAH